MASFPDRTEPLPVGRPESRPAEEASDAFTIGANLYQLALKYWSLERPEDAVRVGQQALEILRQDPRTSELVAALESTLAEITPELVLATGPPSA